MTAPFGFPINLAVRDRRCVVIGGGEEAALRALRLRDAGADLVVVTPDPCDALRELVDVRVEHRARTWVPEDLVGAAVVIATREDPVDAAAIYHEGRANGALVNVLDDVGHCDYAAMSQIVHGDFQLSIATNGRAPAVAKVVRRRLESVFGPEWGELVAVADEARRLLGDRHVEFDEWARRWGAALADPDALIERLRRGDRAGVRSHIVEVVRDAAGGVSVARDAEVPLAGPPVRTTSPDPVDVTGAGRARVHLVGAGPGDPDLLTVRAARLLAEADLVVHDQLVTPGILRLAGPHARIVSVGRRLGRVVLPHEEVIELLVQAAVRGQRVVRLKGGDPVIFGRGTEEALALAERGVVSELVPGVSSPVAAPELAGIPLTHRGVSTGFLVLTGRCAEGTGDAADWELAARFSGTVVVLMAATRVSELSERLQGLGRAASTPAAIIERAGHPEQRVVTSTLAGLASDAAAAGIGTPAVVVIGGVVEIRAAVQHAGAAAASHSRRTSTAACL